MAGITQWLMNPLGNLLNLFNTSNDGKGTIWNHDNGYESSSFTEEGNKNAGNFGVDPNGYVSGMWNDLMGFTSQSREFSQQEYLQDKMNEYNSPENQMARMRAAGINPNIAAAGIAGSGNESAQAPAVSNNQNGVANGIGQAAGAIASLGAGAAGFAGAGLAGKQAEEIATMLPIKASALTNESRLTLENIGLVKAQAEAISIANYYKPQELQLGIARAQLELPFMMSQMRLFNGQYERDVAAAKLDLQKIEESKATISLMDYQKGLMSAQTALANAQANRTTQVFNMINSMGWDPATGIGGLVGTALLNPDYSEENVSRIFGSLSTYAYDQARAGFLGSNGLTPDDGKSLFEHQYEYDIKRDKFKVLGDAVGKLGDFGYDQAGKLLDRPSLHLGKFGVSSR